jgi:hypothetical protein
MVAAGAAACHSGGAAADGDASSSSSSETGDPAMTSAPPTSATNGTESSGDPDSGESSSEGGESGPMPVGPCADDPATPDGQTGTPTALRTWDTESEIDEIVVDGDGRRFIAGRFGGSLSFDEQVFEAVVDPGETEGAQDTFVAALAADGSLLWLHQVHGDGNGVYANALAIDDDGFVYFGGEFGQSLWMDDTERGTWESTGRQGVIAKFSGDSGEVRWIRPITGPENEAGVMQLLPMNDGGAIAAIEWQNGSWALNDEPAVATAGGVAYLRIDGYGKSAWWQQAVWNNVSWIASTGIQASDDGIVAAMWTEGFDDGSVASVSMGGTPMSNAAYASSYIVRVDGDGKVAEASAFQTPASMYINDIDLAPCGDLVVAGSWGGELDLGDGPLGEIGAFLWRRSSDGNSRWSVAVPGDVYFSRVVVDADGQATVAGVDGTLGAIERYSAAGEPLWKTAFDNGTSFGISDAMALAPDGGVVLGSYYYSLDVPGFPMIPSGEGDPVASAFMIDLAP